MEDSEDRGVPEHDLPAFGRWSHDLATGAWWISPEVCAMWDVGIGADGPIETVLARLHPEDLPGIEQSLTRTLTDGTPLSGQGRLRTDHGQRVFAFYGDVVDSGDGSHQVVSGYSIDVTAEARRVVQGAVDGIRRHGAAIEHLKGALMVVYGLDEQGAFNVLRTVSMTHNVKLNLVAERAMALATARAQVATSLLELVEEAARTLASRTPTAPPPSRGGARRERRIVIDGPDSPGRADGVQA